MGNQSEEKLHREPAASEERAERRGGGAWGAVASLKGGS